jgi:hypothetical protein
MVPHFPKKMSCVHGLKAGVKGKQLLLNMHKMFRMIAIVKIIIRDDAYITSNL